MNISEIAIRRPVMAWMLMSALIIIFAISAVGLAVLFGYQLARLRSGRVFPEDGMHAEEVLRGYASVGTVQIFVRETSEYVLSHVVLRVLRHSMAISFFVRRKIDRLVPHIHQMAKTHHEKIISKEGSSGHQLFEAVGKYKKVVRARLEGEKKGKKADSR